LVGHIAQKKIAEKLDILKVPFSVNTAAQMAAISALEDDDHINFSVEHNSKWKKILNDCFAEVGLIVYPSQCNFILVEFLESSKFSAKEFYHLLSSKGIIVREMEEYNLPNCLRITIGKEEANLLLIETVNAFKK
jgi:histidinol-phosphate aminotransferase